MLFKFPKEIKDAKGNIWMHYKTSQNITRLDLTSYYNMDGSHKMRGAIKKETFGSTKVCIAVIGKK